MRKVMKIALVASTMLAISFTLGCGTGDKDEEKWCVAPMKANNIDTKMCYKISPNSSNPIARTETTCVLAGLESGFKLEGPPKKSECTIYDPGDGSNKSK